MSSRSLLAVFLVFLMPALCFAQVTGSLLEGQGAGTSPLYTTNPSVAGNYFLNSLGNRAMFQSGTWTPQLNFGGVASGTCSSCNGIWTWSGQIAVLAFVMNLTSKGTATGAVTITGFPSNMGGNSGTNQYGVCGYQGGMSLAAGYNVEPQMGSAAAANIQIVAVSGPSNFFGAVNDVNFTNATNLQCTITYATQN